MAKIKKRKPKKSSGAYERLFGNDNLGELISKVQSAVISSGNELERIVSRLVEDDGRIIKDVDEFLSLENVPKGTYVVPKGALKKSEKMDVQGVQPDFVVLDNEEHRKHCYIIELKDGDSFDTKKSAAEKKNLTDFETSVSRRLPYTTSVHICCFNQQDKAAIISGLKNEVTEEEAMTGKDFCNLLKIDYENIVSEREKDQQHNFDFFVDELLCIDEVKDALIRKNNL